MEATKIEDCKKSILITLNEKPYHFLGQRSRSVKINGEECRVARDNIKGGIIVWAMNSVFHFYWDKNNENWF